MKDNLLDISNIEDVFFLFIYALVLFALTIYLSDQNKSLWNVLFFNFGVRLFSCFCHYFVGYFPIIGLPFPDSQEDAIWFYQGGLAVDLPFYLLNMDKIISNGPEFYKLILKIVNTLTLSEHILIFALFNSILSMITVKTCYKITTMIWDKNTALITCFILACLPVFITYSIITLRESITCFLYTLGMFNYLLYYQSNKILFLIKSLLLITFAGLFHGGILISVPTLLILTVFYLVKFRDSGTRTFVRLFVIVFGVGFILGISSVGIGSDKLGAYTSEDTTEEAFIGRDAILELREGGGDLEYGNQVSLTSLSDFVIHGPFLFFNFLFRPKPFEYLADAMRLPGSWVMYTGIIFLFYKPKLFFSSLDRKILILNLFITWFIFSLGCTNVGQADRHRMKLLPIFVCIIAKPIADYRKRKESKYLNKVNLT
jgi:hypothetical protein